MKATAMIVTFFSFLFFALTGVSPAVDPGPLCAPRPQIGLQGTPNADLSLDILSVSYDDRLGEMDITLRNWESMQYKYSDGTALSPGAQISLFIGCGATPQKVADGRIASVAPGFHRSAPSTITVSAKTPRSLPSSRQIKLDYGVALREFFPVLKDTVIEAKGTTDGMPDLRTGATLMIGGVGQRYSGEYTVTRAVHIFDNTSGYITQFTAQKKSGRGSLSSFMDGYTQWKDIQSDEEPDNRSLIAFSVMLPDF